MTRIKSHKKTIQGLDKFHEKKRWLIEGQQDFQTSTSTYTAKIHRWREGKEYIDFYFDSITGKKTFILSNQLKKQIRENGHKVPDVSDCHIKYCVYNYPMLQPNCELRDVYEIDINSAYVTACLNLGLIDQQMFDKLNKVDKITRLKCLGSIATRNTIQLYEAGNPTNIHIKQDLTLRNTWFYIVRTIDQILLNFAEMFENFLFYYVDGIYIWGQQNVIEIVQMLESKGYKSKVRENMTIEVGSLGDLLVTDDDGDERFFSVRRNDGVRKWINV